MTHVGGLPAGVGWYLVEEVPAGRFVLDGPEGKHAGTVRRARSGDRIVLTDGRGTCCSATVVNVSGGAVTLDCDRQVHVQPAEPRVTIAQAIPKGDRSDLAVDLLTEAGVDGLIPWQADRCVARWVGDKAARGRQKWQSVAREAGKQARRAWIPEVAELAGRSMVVAAIKDADLALVLHEAEAAALHQVPLPTVGSLLLIVGPEGGVSPAELTAFTDAGAAAVRLGPQVLRTSSAGAVALGAIGVLTARWSASTP